MYRAERSGVLGGLSRVRSIWLNDAHNFCALDQVGAEVAGVLAMMAAGARGAGLRADGFRLSLRGRGREVRRRRRGWDLAEEMLRDGPGGGGRRFVEAPGEAAFYGPKIDVQILDAAGREMTLATVQIDFLQPARFDLSYVDRDGSRQRPVMVHRSIVGSMERLFAHLIEVHEGAFPAWYAPVQVVVLPVGEDQADAAAAFARRCVEAGLRAEAALEGSLGSRVREAALRRVPYVAVIGAREAASGEVSLRLRDGREMPRRPAAEALALIRPWSTPDP